MIACIYISICVCVILTVEWAYNFRWEMSKSHFFLSPRSLFQPGGLNPNSPVGRFIDPGPTCSLFTSTVVKWRTATAWRMASSDQASPLWSAGSSLFASKTGAVTSLRALRVWAARKFRRNTLGRSGSRARRPKAVDSCRRHCDVTEVVLESINTETDGKRTRVDTPWSDTFVWDRSKCSNCMPSCGKGAGATPPETQDTTASVRCTEPERLKWVKCSGGKPRQTKSSNNPVQRQHNNRCNDGLVLVGKDWEMSAINWPIKSGQSWSCKIFRLIFWQDLRSKRDNWESVNSGIWLRNTSIRAWFGRKDRLRHISGPAIRRWNGGRLRDQTARARPSLPSSTARTSLRSCTAMSSGRRCRSTSSPLQRARAKVSKQIACRLGTMATMALAMAISWISWHHQIEVTLADWREMTKSLNVSKHHFNFQHARWFYLIVNYFGNHDLVASLRVTMGKDQATKSLGRLIMVDPRMHVPESNAIDKYSIIFHNIPQSKSDPSCEMLWAWTRSPMLCFWSQILRSCSVQFHRAPHDTRDARMLCSSSSDPLSASSAPEASADSLIIYLQYNKYI